jgi:3-deoxy-D-manno-octulosonic-acid transferase
VAQLKRYLPVGHWLYRVVIYSLLVPTLLWLWWRGNKEPAYRSGFAERLGFVQPNAVQTPSAMGGLWVHVASVGEAQAALTLLAQLQTQWGDQSITLTTQTPAAKALLIERTHGQLQVLLAPIDTVGSVRRFLNRVQPRMLILLEREIWPEWLWQCEQRAITVALVNARLKPGASQRWPYHMKWLQQRIQMIDQVLCADSTSTEEFARLGLAQERINLTGNLKFDIPVASGSLGGLANVLNQRTVIVAASTHQADENAILSGWHDWAAKHPNALMVLAPRHPQRFEAVSQRLENELGLKPGTTLARQSLGHEVGKQTKILLLDTIGELNQFYSHAVLCLMGGTWSLVGGHNALEALAAGCPVLFGPNTQQFPDLYSGMANTGAGLSVSPDQIWPVVDQCLSGREKVLAMKVAGRAFVAGQQGSAERTLSQLAKPNAWPKFPMPQVIVQGAPHDQVWLDAEFASAVSAESFNPNSFSGKAKALATGSGRGQAFKVNQNGNTWVLRHYRRGGFIAKFNHDRYAAKPVSQSRGMQEFLLLRQMRSMGLPVPRPIAARFFRAHKWFGGFSGYRADILIEYITNTRNLAQWLGEQRLPPKAWQAVGKAIARMHKHQIHHSDLNCHNILINDSYEVWIVDFDKCSRRSVGAWQAQNLQRLLRSLRKQLGKSGNLCWHEEDWKHLIQGYQTKHN